MTTYQEITTDYNYSFIQRVNEEGIVSIIPIDPANSDYQAYLRWLNGEEENGPGL